MNEYLSIFVIHVLFIVNLSFVKSANITELCSDSNPVDAGIKYPLWTYLIKGSKVWRLAMLNVDVEGPLLLKDVFPKLDVDSVDALFQVSPDLSVNDVNTQSMSWLTFLLSAQNYYIYMKQLKDFIYYENTTGVPFKLRPGKGEISLFTGDKRAVDAVVFNRIKYEALFLVQNDVFIVSSFEKWSDSTPYITRSTILDTFGVSDRVDAAIDFTDKVMLIFGQTYCDFNWSERKCDKKSLKTYLNCNESDITTVNTTVIMASADTSMTTTIKPINDTDLTTVFVTPNPTEAKVKDSSKGISLLIIVVIGMLILMLVLFLVIIAFFTLKKSTNHSEMSQNSSVISKTHKSSKDNPPSSFSEAFGPTPKT